MYLFMLHIWVHSSCLQTHQRRAGIRSFTDGCESSCGYWGLNSGPLEEQPSLRPNYDSFVFMLSEGLAHADFISQLHPLPSSIIKRDYLIMCSLSLAQPSLSSASITRSGSMTEYYFKFFPDTHKRKGCKELKQPSWSQEGTGRAAVCSQR
jgi:hypothetical protein